MSSGSPAPLPSLLIDDEMSGNQAVETGVLVSEPVDLELDDVLDTTILKSASSHSMSSDDRAQGRGPSSPVKDDLHDRWAKIPIGAFRSNTTSSSSRIPPSSHQAFAAIASKKDLSSVVLRGGDATFYLAAAPRGGAAAVLRTSPNRKSGQKVSERDSRRIRKKLTESLLVSPVLFPMNGNSVGVGAGGIGGGGGGKGRKMPKAKRRKLSSSSSLPESAVKRVSRSPVAQRSSPRPELVRSRSTTYASNYDQSTSNGLHASRALGSSPSSSSFLHVPNLPSEACPTMTSPLFSGVNTGASSSIPPLNLMEPALEL